MSEEVKGLSAFTRSQIDCMILEYNVLAVAFEHHMKMIDLLVYFIWRGVGRSAAGMILTARNTLQQKAVKENQHNQSGKGLWCISYHHHHHQPLKRNLITTTAHRGGERVLIN